MGVTYDTGALLAAERNDRRMWSLRAGFPAEQVSRRSVLTHAWRGGPRQASLARLLGLRRVEEMTEQQAKAAHTGNGNPQASIPSRG